MNAAAVVNPYEVHRLLWTAFPGMPEASRPYLFRVLRGHRGASREVLMQSERKPSRSGDPRVVLLDSRPFSPRFSAGQRLKFDIRANPVKRLASSGVRVPLIREDERLAWLKRHLNGAAMIESARITASEILYFRKPGMRPGKIEAVTFAGSLRVKEPERFLMSCRSGIGPAKSFGCGLLLLAKA